MVSYLKQAPTGVPGDVSRPSNSTVEPIKLVPVGGTTYPSALGIPLKLVAGGAQQFNGGAETKVSFAGILVREVPNIAGDVGSDSDFFPTAPWGKQVQGLLTQGWCNVLVAAGTPARGGTVYLQIVANNGVAVGSFRADGTDSGNAIALDQAQACWASDGVGLDDNGNIDMAEIKVAGVLGTGA